MKLAFGALLLLTLLAGCGTTSVPLTYSATEPRPAATDAHPVAIRIGSIAVTDARDEPDPHFIGSIRGGFGNPLKTLASTQPAAGEVTTAFTTALEARGWYAAGGAGLLDVKLKQLSADQYERREGHTAFSLKLTDRAGHVLFQDDEDVLKIGGSILALDVGVFGSLEELRKITELSLSTAIDQALDKPGFYAALASRAPEPN